MIGTMVAVLTGRSSRMNDVTGLLSWMRLRAERALGWIMGDAWRAPTPVPPEIVSPLPVERRSPTKADDRAADVELSGQWYFRRDILDHLDDYFICIRRMKSHDPDSYALYSNVGAIIAAPDAGAVVRAIDTPDRIAFGAVSLPAQSSATVDTEIHVKFIYFQKMDRPNPSVMPFNGDVYRVVLFYLDRKGGKKGLHVPAEFHVGIDAGGAVRVLKERRPVSRTIRAKTAVAKKMGGRTVVCAEWALPAVAFMIGNRNADPENDAGPAGVLAGFFAWSYNVYFNASNGVRVAVSKNGVVAAFSVDLLRVPYFFADRDAVVSVNGTKKRIFHIVRTHERTTKDGGQTYVRSHFRGLRSFDWRGYRVHITMPGKHHVSMLDAKFGAMDMDALDDGEKRDDLIFAGDVGRRVAKALAA